MSCWVVPTVAAEYWGVTLDVVWRRIYEGLIPHKNDRGFVFVDVDPWTPDAEGAFHHEPPATFVTPQEPLLHQAPAAARAWDEQGVRQPAVVDDHECACAPTPAACARQEEDREDDDDELPPLDDEETATFGRLSWHDVRQRVSRTRRPPPVLQD